MKCNKCGYVSFDYLSECKKCGVSLDATREGLGFGTAKPNMPSFLGPLLKDYVKPPEEPSKEEPESGFSFDFGEDLDSEDIQAEASPGNGGDEEIELAPETLLQSERDPALDALEAGLGFEPEPEPVQSAPARQGGPGIPAEQPEGDDFSLLDITDEEMDLLIAADDDEKVGQVEEPLRMAEPARTETAGLEETVLIPAMGGESEEAAIGFQPDARLAKEDANGLIPRFDVNSLPGLSERPAPVEPEPSEVKADKITVEDNGLEIALSEKDLKTLLADLEVASRKKEEKTE